MLNALTVDVEDYFQVSNFENIVKREEWDKYEHRVVNNTRRILDILSKNNTKATFFILGWTAKRFPEIIEKIDREGHEVASHGYSHRLVYKMSKEEFRDELAESVNILERITGKKVIGYRAASCSITQRSLWAFDILRELGIKYDASIFPIHHDRYGIPAAERYINSYNHHGVVEFPFSTVQVLGQNLPVAGGGYFRLYPYWFTRLAIHRINGEGFPAMIYVHPWEIDDKQPRMDTNFTTRFRHYVNIEKTQNRLEHLLKDFKFTRAADVIKSFGFIG
jgi:polysaccharide deacetylase family protein (PEP-CTERM system associated)